MVGAPPTTHALGPQRANGTRDRPRIKKRLECRQNPHCEVECRSFPVLNGIVENFQNKTRQQSGKTKKTSKDFNRIIRRRTDAPTGGEREEQHQRWETKQANRKSTPVTFLLDSRQH